MTLLGGAGTIAGPVVGTFVLVALRSYFAEAGASVTIVQGLMFVACVMLFPKGIVGQIETWIKGRHLTLRKDDTLAARAR